MGLDARAPAREGDPALSEKRRIDLAAPFVGESEKAYVADCLDSTWISSAGAYVERFEQGFAEFCEARHAISCTNGTTALHLALMALGVGPGDEVIVPTLTFVATANAVTHCGARPVFVDAEPDTWNIDPRLVEAKITPRTRGIIVVHLLGHPADTDPILAIARRHGLFLVEDAAQSPGARHRGRRVGSLGDVAAFSFYANKIITTGEGGMVVTNDDALAAKIRLLKAHGRDPRRRYSYSMVGYNYRMTNVTAAIGVAQLERVGWQLERRREIAGWYREGLQDLPEVTWQREQDWATHVWWIFSVLLDEGCPADRDAVMAAFQEAGIETRPVEMPIHQLVPYRHLDTRDFPVAERVGRRSISLPTWAGVTREDVDYVCAALRECVVGATSGVR
jgi:perosamine synthetase